MRAKKDINISIGNQIRVAREAAGLTQEKFSEMVSLAPKNISDIERGVVGISLSSLKRICETLSISSDDLLFGPRDNNGSQSEVAVIAGRLEKLSPKQFEIAAGMINKMFEALASTPET